MLSYKLNLSWVSLARADDFAWKIGNFPVFFNSPAPQSHVSTLFMHHCFGLAHPYRLGKAWAEQPTRQKVPDLI